MLSGKLGHTFLSNAAIAACGLATGVILARTLGPAGRGDLAAAIQWASVTLALADMGLGFAIARRVGVAPDEASQLWWFGLATAGIWGTLAASACSLLLPRFLHGAASELLRVAIWVVPAGLALGFQAYLLLGKGRVKAHNAVRFSAALTYTIGVATVVMLGHASERLFVLVFVGSQAIGAVVALLFLGQSLRPRQIRTLKLPKELFGFGLKAQVASIGSFASLRLDQLLLSILVSPADLGLYVVAVAASSLISPVFTAFATVIVPRVNRIADHELAAKTVRLETLKAMLLCVPVVLVAFALMPKILLVLFGPSFRGSLSAARILVVASLFQGSNSILGNATRSIGRPWFSAIAEAVGMVATVALLAALLPSLGFMGAAIASLAAYCSVSLVYLFLLLRFSSSTSPALSLGSTGVNSASEG